MTDPTPKPSAVTQAGRSDYMSGYYSGLLQADSLARNYLYSRGWLINFILDAQGTRAGISRLIREFAGLTWIDDNGPVPEGEAPWEIEATQASHTAEVERLRAENEALRADLKRYAGDDEVVCEGCGASLYFHDSYASDENGCSGCWATMVEGYASDMSKPCYAYRVGKPDGRTATGDRHE